MSLLAVLKDPNKELRQRSVDVNKSDIGSERIKKLIEDMIETMIAENGIGIAAPQVGVGERVIIVEMEGEMKAYINPKIFSKSLRKIESEEGCLSVPNIFGVVMRHKKVKVKAFDPDGNKVQMSLTGMPAIIFQHEIDHLNGILFIDKVERLTSPPKM